MNKPFFSVVVPTYNREKFIIKTLESIFAQTYPEYEVIVVDNCSTDNTADVLKEYIESKKIQFIRNDRNYERAKSRNTGVFYAKGDYVNWFDSDDLMLPNHLEEAKSMILSLNQPEVFHLAYELRDLRDNLMEKKNSFPKIVNDLMYKGNLLSCNGIFLRKDIASEINFNENPVLSGSEDYDLWMRLAARFPIYCSNEITSIIVHHGERTMVNIDAEKIDARISLAWNNLWEDEFIAQKYGRHKKFMFAFKEAFMALNYSEIGLKRKAIQRLTNSLKAYPLIIKHKIVYAVAKRIFLNNIKNV